MEIPGAAVKEAGNNFYEEESFFPPLKYSKPPLHVVWSEECGLKGVVG
jgi:hypothetical protein